MENFLTFFKKGTDVKPLLQLFHSGKFIRLTFSVFIQIIVVVSGLFALGFWFNLWRFITELRFLGGIALLIFQVFFPYAVFLSLKTLFLRANEIENYPDSDYIVVPIIAMLTKTYGEMMFIFYGIMSIPFMLMTWTTGGNFVRNYGVFFPNLGVRNIFLLGLLAFLVCWVIAYLTLIFTKFLAEWIQALFSIANDIGALRRNSFSMGKESVPAAPVVDEGVAMTTEN